MTHFLVCAYAHKRKQAEKLDDEMSAIHADMEEIQKRRDMYARDNTRAPVPAGSRKKITRDLEQLRGVYFMSKSNINPETNARAAALSDIDLLTTHIDLLTTRENWLAYSSVVKNEACRRGTDRRGTFYEGLCKYAKYSKFEERAGLRAVGFASPSNLICSLSFDRDQEYFVAAGVNKRIRIFDFNRLLSGSVGMHYPVPELNSKYKLSCLSWNNYLNNYLISADYDGGKLWDTFTGAEMAPFWEHRKLKEQ